MRSGPFEQHLREAIELNRRRAPLYAAASDGASRGISRSLIRRERWLLPFARWLDRRGARYQRAGIPLLDDLFVPMHEAPAFLLLVEVDPSSQNPPSASLLTRQLRRAFRTRGFDGAAEALARELERLSRDPGCWCMRRHLLESARRICSMVPLHAEQASAAGLPSPVWMHRLLFRLHLAALHGASRLDLQAYPLQQRGIPILCRDLPPIPPRP